MAESDIAVLGTGPETVRTLTITTLVDGVPTAVKMQVVALADAEGKVFNPIDLEYTNEVLEELRAIRRGMEVLTEQHLR